MHYRLELWADRLAAVTGLVWLLMLMLVSALIGFVLGLAVLVWATPDAQAQTCVSCNSHLERFQGELRVYRCVDDKRTTFQDHICDGELGELSRVPRHRLVGNVVQSPPKVAPGEVKK